MPDNTTPKILWIVRHGLRIDFANPKWFFSAENPYNPPLDSIGFEQAGETAERLKSESIKYIFASPFLRTLQTASLIAEKLKVEINVESGLSEWLTPREFEYQPKLESLVNLNAEFPWINASYDSLVQAYYPEDQEILNARISKTIRGILDKYGSDILIVSHGSPIQSIHTTLLNSIPDLMQPMGSVTQFVWDAEKWVLAIDGDSTHLSTPDKTKRSFYKNYKGARGIQP